LLRLAGDPDNERYVEYLRFVRIQFRHSDWSQPKGGGERFDRPGVDYAAAPQAAFNAPGAIVLRGARYCAIEDCTLEHMGGYGVEIGEGCAGNRVVGNEVADLGAGGVKLDGADANGSRLRRTGNNRITDNHIHGGGRVFHSAVGILSVHSFGNVFAHNHIHDLFYTGISCGWVWGYADNVSMNNRIEKNHIHDIGQGLLSDMGGVYTLGVQPGTVVRGNLIHDVEKRNYGGWAIYLDEGSSHILVENNICYNTSSQGFHQHYGRENIVRNNVFAFGREGQASLSRTEAHNSFTFEKNIVIASGQAMYTAGYAGQLEKKGFRSDLNLFWDIQGEPAAGVNGKHDSEAHWLAVRTFTWDELHDLGYDRHSVIADPHCRDVARYDFSLAADSPALAFGFQPIDLQDVGPRPPDRRAD
jgi:parallel beta-helix repeat protein